MTCCFSIVVSLTNHRRGQGAALYPIQKSPGMTSNTHEAWRKSTTRESSTTCWKTDTWQGMMFPHYRERGPTYTVEGSPLRIVRGGDWSPPHGSIHVPAVQAWDSTVHLPVHYFEKLSIGVGLHNLIEQELHSIH